LIVDFFQFVCRNTVLQKLHPVETVFNEQLATAATAEVDFVNVLNSYYHVAGHYFLPPSDLTGSARASPAQITGQALCTFVPNDMPIGAPGMGSGTSSSPAVGFVGLGALAAASSALIIIEMIAITICGHIQ
jgi:hypothetical protein